MLPLNLLRHAGKAPAPMAGGGGARNGAGIVNR
jgi:hypothetical protein